MDSIMQTSLKIAKTYNQVCSQGNRITEEEASLWSQNQIKDLSIILQDKLSSDPIDCEQVREVLSVGTQLSKYKENYEIISKIFDAAFIKQFSTYVEAESNQFIEIGIKFVEKMFLDQGYMIFSSSTDLFLSFINKFGNLTSDLARQIITQIIVQMMMDNKKNVQFANQPYFFMEFWLHTINQQNQMDRMLYWLNCVTNLYKTENAPGHLFNDNDLRLLADIIVRVVESVTEGSMLKKPLQCYLALVECKGLNDGGCYRVRDLKEFLSSVNGEQFEVAQQIEKINSLM